MTSYAWCRLVGLVAYSCVCVCVCGERWCRCLVCSSTDGVSEVAPTPRSCLRVVNSLASCVSVCLKPATVSVAGASSDRHIPPPRPTIVYIDPRAAPRLDYISIASADNTTISTSLHLQHHPLLHGTSCITLGLRSQIAQQPSQLFLGTREICV